MRIHRRDSCGTRAPEFGWGGDALLLAVLMWAFAVPAVTSAQDAREAPAATDEAVRVGLVLQPYTARRGLDEISIAPELLYAEVSAVLEAAGVRLAGTTRVELTTEEAGQYGVWQRVSMADGHLGRAVASMAKEETFVLGLLGNCISSWGMLAGLQHAEPQGPARRVGLIWIDAHGDFNTPETTLSGWLGGMPVSVATGQSLTRMRTTAGVEPPIATQDVIMMGLRDVDPLEQGLIDEAGIVTISAADMVGRTAAMHEAVERLANNVDVIYLHVDLDILDASAIPGSFFETRNGPAPEEMAATLRDLMQHAKVAALGIASFPTAEEGRETSLRSTLTLVRAALEGLQARGGQSSLSGEWYFDVESPNGPGQREVLFLQEDERVVGFIDSNAASGRFVGSFDGTSLEFTAVLEFGGQPMAAVYKATVEGDTMSGVIEYGLYGQAEFVGYRGRREVEATPADAPLVGSAREATIEASSSGDFFGLEVEGALLPEMVEIRGGRFQMGRDDAAMNSAGGEDFAHVHAVELSGFRMSRFLVTNAQYLAFAESTGGEPPLPPKGWGDYVHLYPNHPVVNVSATDAAAYSGWLSATTGASYRLPTEAEWEYAARAGLDGRTYVFGDEWDIDGANISVWRIGEIPDRDGWKAWWDSEGEKMSNSQPMTTRVGSFPPNGWGLYDMAGNVWEWTYDWYQSDYYEDSPARNPMGPASGDEKVLRGCSWYNKPDVCLIATRDRYSPDTRLYYNGFRVVATDDGSGQ